MEKSSQDIRQSFSFCVLCKKVTKVWDDMMVITLAFVGELFLSLFSKHGLSSFFGGCILQHPFCKPSLTIKNKYSLHNFKMKSWRKIKSAVTTVSCVPSANDGQLAGGFMPQCASVLI